MRRTATQDSGGYRFWSRKQFDAEALEKECDVAAFTVFIYFRNSVWPQIVRGYFFIMIII